MFASSQNVPHSPSQSPSQNFSDLSSLAEKLQATAQALLSVCHNSGGYAGSGESEVPRESASRDKDIEPPYEIRSYQIPEYILRGEQVLLKASDAADLLELLNKVYDHTSCIVTLMKHIDPEEEVRGFHLNKIAETLLLPLIWLEQLCSLFAGFRLVSHMKTE